MTHTKPYTVHNSLETMMEIKTIKDETILKAVLPKLRFWERIELAQDASSSPELLEALYETNTGTIETHHIIRNPNSSLNLLRAIGKDNADTEFTKFRTEVLTILTHHPKSIVKGLNINEAATILYGS